MTTIIRGKLAFSYSSHKTMDRAEMALEDYYATGDVSELEVADIIKREGCFHIMLWGE